MNNKKFAQFALFSQFIGFLRLKLCRLNKQSKPYKLLGFCFLLYALLFCLPSLSDAKVTGNCVNCHTMHNSQNGQPMATFGGTTGAQPSLLRGTCLGCHGQSASGSSNIIGNIPQVLHNATTDLSGGNFGYVSTKTGAEDNKGHNVIDTGNQEDDIPNVAASFPPGDEHGNFAAGLIKTTFTCAGKYGCHGNRNEPDKLLAIKGAHHIDDTVLKFGSISENGQGGSTGLSYRFLNVVKGGEDSDWQATSSASEHNEYKGAIDRGTESTISSPGGNTISGLCAECHGNFHGPTAGDIANQNASPWLRHPTDIRLDATGTGAGEYGSYTQYSTQAPIARTSIPSNPNSTVTPGDSSTDIIMCLSCHRAHASAYFKLMRWDYKGWPTGGTNGCATCHTWKD